MIHYPVLYAHGSFAFNQHLNADGTTNRTYIQNTVLLDDFQENPGYRDLRDPYHLAQGGALGRVHKGLRVLQLMGRIEVPGNTTQRGAMFDKTTAMRAAFDPYICTRDSPSTDGAYALTFTEKTLDTATYTGGLIPLQYWARPVGQPWIAERLNEEGHRPFRLVLIAGDPRAYEQVEQSLSLSPAGTTGNVVNRGNTAAPLKATITMNGAGNSAFTITRGGVAFILDLSGMSNNDVVVVVFETCAPYGDGRYVTKNGIENATLKTSAASTWLDAPVGTTSFVISNTTNVRTCVLSWYSARA